MAKPRSSSTGFTRAGTGTPSSFGRKGASGGRTVNPWGRNVPASFGRGANANGVTAGRGRPGGSSRARNVTDPALRSMDYTPNDPAQWPIEGGKRYSILSTQAKADFNNAVVNNAFKRGGYAG